MTLVELSCDLEGGGAGEGRPAMSEIAIVSESVTVSGTLSNMYVFCQNQQEEYIME